MNQVEIPRHPVITPAANLGELALLSFQGRRANVIWTQLEFTLLCEHLHNNNADTHWIMGFRKDGKKYYKRSKQKPAHQGISWAWSTIVGKVKAGNELAFAPYSCNAEGQSRWGAMDFDAHDGEADRARRLAFASFQALLNIPGFSLILESTGSGGWHLWVISQVFYPVGEWVRLLKTIATAIDAPLTAGICEIFPSGFVPSEFGLGIRAPGCWNPSVDVVGEIYWATTDSLFASLSGKCTQAHTGHFPDKRKKIISLVGSLSQQKDGAPGLYSLWAEVWHDRYAITQPATRNSQLCGLTGEMFFQVGFDMGHRIATTQFQARMVSTSADLKKHLEDFTSCWQGLAKCWEKQLHTIETDQFVRLITESERDAFRIIWSYARKASMDGVKDFPVARDNLAERLGISGPGAGGIRRKFTKFGILELTRNYKPNKTAARYAWLLRAITEFPPVENTIASNTCFYGVAGQDRSNENWDKSQSDISRLFVNGSTSCSK